MSKVLCRKVRKDRTPKNGLILSEYEKAVILGRLGKAVEKLKQARIEIREVIKLVVRLKEKGDTIADQVLSAVVEVTSGTSNFRILGPNVKETMKREAAKPLLLLRAD